MGIQFLMTDHTKYIARPGQPFDLKNHDANRVEPGIHKPNGKSLMKSYRKEIASLQDMFFACDRYSLLLIFQALDAAGKDSTIRHVFRKVKPQGVGYQGFLPPSREEKRHDFLWRVHRHVPGRGMIQVFNRSHYEEVTTTRVHPEYILEQQYPGIESTDDIGEEFWEERFRQINDFERLLVQNASTAYCRPYRHGGIVQ